MEQNLQQTSEVNMNSINILVPTIVLLLVLACVECQLTFSPDWGKRSVGSSGSNTGAFFDPQPGNCKTSNEMLLEIFRFVQNEAQLFLDCKHRE